MQYTHEFHRTTKEAFGKSIDRTELEPRRLNLTPDQVVFWGCIAVSAALVIASLAGVQLGGQA